IPILFTLSNQSSGTLPNFSASIAMGLISFSANQCVISLIWFCCSDNLKSIIPLHLLYRLLKFVRLVEEANPFHDRIASPEPKHLVPIFLPDTPGYNHAHQEVERLNQSHTVPIAVPRAMRPTLNQMPPPLRQQP